MLDDERIEMRLFPDLRNVSFEGSHVVMLETDVKALWSLVPATSKADIGKVGERLISLLRDRLVSIIGQPAFAGDYRDPLPRIVEDAYERMWRDPQLQPGNRPIRDMIHRAGAEHAGAARRP